MCLFCEDDMSEMLWSGWIVPTIDAFLPCVVHAMGVSIFHGLWDLCILR